MDNGATVNSTDLFGKTMLHMAIKTGNVSLVEELLTGKEFIEKTNSKKQKKKKQKTKKKTKQETIKSSS